MKRKEKLYEIEEIESFRALLGRSEKKYGTKTAFIYKEDPSAKEPVYIQKTYQDLANDVRKLGTKLLDLGLEEEKVAVIGPNRYEWCVSYFGVTTANMTIVPLDKSLPNNEIESLIIRSGAKAVIFDEQYLEVFEKLKCENTSSLEHYICMDAKVGDLINWYDLLLENGEVLLENGDTRYAQIKQDSKKSNIMLFTSGTTAISKAAMLSQYNICSNIRGVREVVQIYETDVFLSFLPLHHTLECTTTFLTGLYSGGTIAFCDGLKYIARNLAEYKVTAFICVPLMLETMYKKIQKGIEESGKANVVKIMTVLSQGLLKVGIDIRKQVFASVLEKMGGHLRLLFSGAAAIDKEVVKGFQSFGINIMQGYGLTETSPVLCVENDKYKRAGSVGFPLPDVTIEIVNKDEQGVGEIRAKGPNIMEGYYENEEATNEVLKDGWFYTGDLGFIDKDGYVFMKGRAKTVIVLKNGKNIYPEEIEILVNQMPFVKESMVYETDLKKDDIDLGCKIIYDEDMMKERFGETAEEACKKIIWEEIKKINKTMPPYKYIREIVVSTEPLIKTTTQKIKRHEELKRIKNA